MRRSNRENFTEQASAPPTLVQICELNPEAKLRGILRNHNKKMQMWRACVKPVYRILGKK